jgi:hypothetical protein
MSPKLEEILLALVREGLDASLTYRDPAQIQIRVAPSCTGDSLAQAFYQANRALRICSVLTGEFWGVSIRGEIESQDRRGSVILILDRREIDPKG